jgi:hypothetical protein
MEQINLRSPLLITALKYIAFALIFHFALGWFNGCSSGTKKEDTQTVTIPAISATFKPQKPISKPLEVKQTTIKEVKKYGLVYVENPLNKKLLEENEKLKSDYSKMSDSLKSKTYYKAIELKSFHSKFEDDNLLLNFNGIVRGEVQEITPSYTIKKREVDIKPKETVFRLLAGLETGVSIDRPKLNFKANLMFQNRKGDIISGSFDTNNTAWIGYNKSIFNIKR